MKCEDCEYYQEFKDDYGHVMRCKRDDTRWYSTVSCSNLKPKGDTMSEILNRPELTEAIIEGKDLETRGGKELPWSISYLSDRMSASDINAAFKQGEYRLKPKPIEVPKYMGRIVRRKMSKDTFVVGTYNHKHDKYIIDGDCWAECDIEKYFDIID
jgi:hypothetical protein